MREPDTEGNSQPQWPRCHVGTTVRACLKRWPGHVQAGYRAAKNPKQPGADAVQTEQKATPTTPTWRGVADLAGSLDPVHAQNLFAREPGDPTVPHGPMQPLGRDGKSKDVIRR